MNISEDSHVWYDVLVTTEPVLRLADKRGELAEYLRTEALETSRGEFYRTGAISLESYGSAAKESSSKDAAKYFATVSSFGFGVANPSSVEELKKDSGKFLSSIFSYYNENNYTPAIKRIRTRTVIYLGVEQEYDLLAKHVANRLIPNELVRSLDFSPTDSHQAHFDFYDEEVQKCLRFEASENTQTLDILNGTSIKEYNLASTAFVLDLKEFQYPRTKPISYTGCKAFVENRWQDSRKTISKVTKHFLGLEYPW